MRVFFLPMIREEISLETLALSDETKLNSILNKIKVTGVNSRIKFKKACDQLQGNNFVKF